MRGLYYVLVDRETKGKRHGPEPEVSRVSLVESARGAACPAVRGWRIQSAFCDVCGWQIPPLAKVTERSDPKDFEGRPHVLEVLVTRDQGRLSGLGEGGGEAIAQIQPGGVAALAEVEESLPRQVRLLDGERFDDDGSGHENSSPPRLRRGLGGGGVRDKLSRSTTP